MTDAQRRATDNHRRRLRASGLSRFEVRGLESDKALLRAAAARLARCDQGAALLRAAIEAQVGSPTAKRGGVYEALRRSPLVGVELELERETSPGRDSDI